jgi:hypothetical protein
VEPWSRGRAQVAGRLMDCTSGEAGRRGRRKLCGAALLPVPLPAACQAMRAGIVEFGGVQEEEEEVHPENPGPTWANLGSLH